MRLSLVIAGLLAVSARPPPERCTPSDCDDDFDAFLRDEGVPVTRGELAYRKGVFAENVKAMRAHNAAGLSWKMGTTPFSHLTAAEFSAYVSSRILSDTALRATRALRGSAAVDVEAAPAAGDAVDVEAAPAAGDAVDVEAAPSSVEAASRELQRASKTGTPTPSRSRSNTRTPSKTGSPSRTPSKTPSPTKTPSQTRSPSKTPSPALNWFAAGKVTGVKNQAACGSCYAFAATAVIEAATSIKYGVAPVSLSEQQIVDCSSSAPTNNLGCQGGYLGATLDYTIGGLCTSVEYPYTSGNGVSGTCVTTCTKVATNTGKAYVSGRSAIEARLAVQPLMIAINGGAAIFQNYASGVMSPSLTAGFTSGDNFCGSSVFSPNGYGLNHAVALIGMGTDAVSGKGYWLIKNSWGTAWGEAGFARLERSTTYDASGGACLMQIDVAYPIAA